MVRRVYGVCVAAAAVREVAGLQRLNAWAARVAGFTRVQRMFMWTVKTGKQIPAAVGPQETPHLTVVLVEHHRAAAAGAHPTRRGPRAGTAATVALRVEAGAAGAPGTPTRTAARAARAATHK